MNKVYDNGNNMLGKVKDILMYIDENSLDNDVAIDLFNELKLYNRDSIVFIDYSNGMSYTIDEFDEKDVIWRSE